MRIVKPSFKVLEAPEYILEKIEEAGRVYYKPEGKVDIHSAVAFAKELVERGDLSKLIHVCITVHVVCSKNISHELVSPEFIQFCGCDKDGEVSFIKPLFFPNIPVGLFGPASKYHTITCDEWVWIHAMEAASASYRALLDEKCSVLEARSVLPDSVKTEVVMTLNLRSWIDFFEQRTAKVAHPQMKEIARPMLEEFKKNIPVIFDNIKY